MRTELTNLNHCAVPLLSRDAVILSWYDSIMLYKNNKNSVSKCRGVPQPADGYVNEVLSDSNSREVVDGVVWRMSLGRYSSTPYQLTDIVYMGVH